MNTKDKLQREAQEARALDWLQHERDQFVAAPDLHGHWGVYCRNNRLWVFMDESQTLCEQVAEAANGRGDPTTEAAEVGEHLRQAFGL